MFTTRNLAFTVCIALFVILVGTIVYKLFTLQNAVMQLERQTQVHPITVMVEPTVSPTATPAGTLKIRVLAPTSKAK